MTYPLLFCNKDIAPVTLTGPESHTQCEQLPYAITQGQSNSIGSYFLLGLVKNESTLSSISSCVLDGVVRAFSDILSNSSHSLKNIQNKLFGMCVLL